LKGFVITLSPKDASGVERNREYYECNKAGLPLGGKVELSPEGVLKCTWVFPGLLPDSVKENFLKRVREPLDEAIAKTPNVSYKVDFL